MDIVEENKENSGVFINNITLSQDEKDSKTPCLASVIQEHLEKQSKRLFEEEIFKESVVKCSLDKDFKYLFQQSGLKIKRQKPQIAIADTKKVHKIYNNYQKVFLKWLSDNEQKTVMHLPFNNYSEIFQLLNSKLQNDKLVILITEYHQYFAQKLQQINERKKDSIRWASLSSSLDIETKSKILQLYQLHKLNFLLLTPELFENQKYQQFKTDILIIANIHMYESQPQLLQRIKVQTQPSRILGCYEYLTKPFQKKLGWFNTGRLCQFDNTVWLKGNNKCKNFLNYLSKKQFLRTLVIVRDKKSSDELTSSLSLEAYKVVNFTQIITKQIWKSFTMPKILISKKGNLQEQLYQSLKKSFSSTIIISPYFEPLRLLQYDLVVFYDQPSIQQYMQMESLSVNKLGLLSDQDFYISRNVETSSIVDRTIFQKLVSHILDRKVAKQNQKKVKRFYSQSLDEFTPIDPTSNMKSIAINKYCEEYEISKPQLICILQLLKDLNLLILMQPVKYECLIEQRSSQQFKNTFPQYNLMSRRINILNLAAEFKTTTNNIIQTMKNNNIRFLVCEQLIPIKLLPNTAQNTVQTAWVSQQQNVLRGIRQIDLSYTLFDQFTFPNTQFLRKDKLVHKKKQMTSLFQSYITGQLELLKLPLFKINNVNKKIIQQWVSQLIHQKLTVHDMVLFLQGTLTQRTSIHQDEPIFKTFYRYKYQELAQLLEEILKNKKRKIN